MRVASIVLSALLLGMALWSAAAVSEGSDAPGGREMVRFSLDADATYRLGAPVRMDFSLENLTDENLWILKWHTPCEGILNRIFDVTCGGREIPYEGRMLKRGNPTPNDYLKLAPHEKMTCTFDLASVYTLPAKEECHVSFVGRLLDVSRSEPKAERSAEQALEPMTIRGNDVTIRILGER
jgi:hypothetical protein